MKFNLKNRPKYQPTNPVGKPTSLYDMEKWFQAFEKELQKMLEEYRKDGYYYPEQILKEILGE